VEENGLAREARYSMREEDGPASSAIECGRERDMVGRKERGAQLVDSTSSEGGEAARKRGRHRCSGESFLGLSDFTYIEERRRSYSNDDVLLERAKSVRENPSRLVPVVASLSLFPGDCSRTERGWV